MPLSPLPCETSEESNQFRRIGSEGFIDEEAVSRVIARGAYGGTGMQHAGIALSASGDDYAGWVLPVQSPFRKMTGEHMASRVPTRLPGPPTLHTETEAGIGTAYLGGHRWWLFGMSGAMTCGIMALTLFSLAQRHDMVGLAAPAVAAKVSQENPGAADKKPALQPSLTTALPVER